MAPSLCRRRGHFLAACLTRGPVGWRRRRRDASGGSSAVLRRPTRVTRAGRIPAWRARVCVCVCVCGHGCKSDGDAGPRRDGPIRWTVPARSCQLVGSPNTAASERQVQGLCLKQRRSHAHRCSCRLPTADRCRIRQQKMPDAAAERCRIRRHVGYCDSSRSDRKVARYRNFRHASQQTLATRLIKRPGYERRGPPPRFVFIPSMRSHLSGHIQTGAKFGPFRRFKPPRSDGPSIIR